MQDSTNVSQPEKTAEEYRLELEDLKKILAQGHEAVTLLREEIDALKRENGFLREANKANCL